MKFYFKDELIHLLPEKAAYLPLHRVLLIADVHLGKATHFRKEGIIIPVPPMSRDLTSIKNMIQRLKPKTIIFMGDLFHSKLNREWISLIEFLEAHPEIRFILTKGNHDILPPKVMEHAPIEVVDEFQLGNHLLCTHQPLEDHSPEMLNIAGHVHPGILIKTKSRQSYRLPCFYQLPKQLILPAFGQLTGLHLIKKIPGARIFPILPTEVIEWN